MRGSMDVNTTTLEEFLGAVLRGAAKILGCGSTNLVFINDKTQKISIRIGTPALAHPVVRSVEQVLGNRVGDFVFPIKAAVDSLVYRAWRERKSFETSSFSELVGTAFPQLITRQMTKLIGEIRFICVPALSVSRNYGVLVFSKEGAHPFNRQQREVILRYARRIGEILENDLMGQGQQLFADLRVSGPDYYLFSGDGTLLGTAAGTGAAPEVVAELSERARKAGTLIARASEDKRDELVPFQLQGAPAVLVRRQRPEPSDTPVTLENQLLQLTLGDAMPSLFLDPQLKVTSCNQATEQALGYSPKSLVGRHIGNLFANPREIELILSQQVLDPSNPYCEESATVVRGDGAVTPARVEALLLAGENEDAVGFLLLIRPLEEGAAARSEDRLVQQERLATMGELAAQLAHEMRNPLVAIGANLESLTRDSTLSDEHRAILTSVTREITRMDMSLKDYLAARHDMSFAEVDVARAVEDARKLLEAAFRTAGKRVTSQIEPGLSVQADYDALKHVLFNLLLNALQASPPEGEVRCSAEAAPHAVSIYIDDQGAGLTASAEDCFRPFYTTKKNGTGLGLTVCQNIARAHGGVVSIKNREGGGCRATVVLPRRAGKSA
jgi:PAS domain S-box-containing protein